MEMPAEVTAAVAAIEDETARQVVQAYADAVLEYVGRLKEQPELSNEACDGLKRPVHDAMCKILPYQGDAAVDEAVLVIAFAEMSLHQC